MIRYEKTAETKGFPAETEKGTESETTQIQIYHIQRSSGPHPAFSGFSGEEAGQAAHV